MKKKLSRFRNLDILVLKVSTYATLHSKSFLTNVYSLWTYLKAWDWKNAGNKFGLILDAATR